MDGTIDEWVRAAKQGDHDKLEKLIAGIQNRIYDLSLRMLMFAADAEDATQDILIKILMHFDDFKGESCFWTWAYRIAVNHLLSLKRYRAKRMGITFDFWEIYLNCPARKPPTFWGLRRKPTGSGCQGRGLKSRHSCKRTAAW